jgi:DNA polymerase III subunit gamma/tau
MDPVASSPAPYRVLARTYRPTRLSELIGQDALVRTLRNAFASGRVAHAFVLAGIRGVGKTTTARIIARGLNCVGPDGKGGPTPEPCGLCESCRSITEERSIDVVEMDAATRTGIDDVRQLVETVAYGPTSSRYKVYVIDEVHMLSKQAFNGLLKTLEEPPPHVKFVFATTEPGKIPVTVLSRCQRFDLRRVEPEGLVAHLQRVCTKERVVVEREALALVARAAEGSVRDALSLLDQAVALSAGPVASATVMEMLGLADRRRVTGLLAAAAAGDTAALIDGFAELQALGADPLALVNDLLRLVHELSRLAARPDSDAGELGALYPGVEGLAPRLGLPELARAWQMLLRGLDEVRAAPDAAAAAEMLLLRLACVSDLPPPAELARLAGREPSASPLPAAPPARATADLKPAPAQPVARTVPVETFAELVSLVAEKGDSFLAAWLHGQARLVRFEPGRIEFAAKGFMPPDLPSRLAETAGALTGRRWIVALSQGDGAPTLAEAAASRARQRTEEAGRDPQIRALLEAFPGAEIVEVREAGRQGTTTHREEGRQRG